MTIREARALKPGDGVFIFVGAERVQAKVVMVGQKFPQRVEIEVEFKDSFGEIDRVQRLQTSAYLTQATATLIALRTGRGPIGERSNAFVEVDPTVVPISVCDAARLVTDWMQRRGHFQWKLLGIQSREE